MALFRRRKPEQREQTNDESEHSGEGKAAKGGWKRPANTAFKQQRLKAWQPILTPKTVLPSLFLVGLLFAPIGGLLIWGSGLVSQITIDYTNCEKVNPSTDPNNLQFSNVPTFDYQLSAKDAKQSVTPPQWAFINNSTANNATTANACFLKFDIPADMGPSVFIYYKLTNFYQNHRRYVKSLDTDQLKGKHVDKKTLTKGDCPPLAVTNSDDKIIYPCGLIANSIFNDTLNNPVLLNPSNGATNQTYNFTANGIAWPGEAKKYATQPNYNLSEIAPPPNWALRYPQGYTNSTPPPDLHNDQHFQNWMRTAGLPTFTKLYGRNDNEVMTKGTYQIMIWSNFPVTPYGGTKSIVISTVSWVGGKNPFLGWAYVGASGLLVLLAIAGTIRHCLKPRRLGDMSQLSWNQPNTR